MIDNYISLPTHNNCTACGACIQACKKECISFVKDDIDSVYPQIDNNKCIKCRACINVCHLNKSFFYPKSKLVFAGWSSDNSIRINSASGGMATSIYKYALENNYKVFGVCFSNCFVANFKEIKNFDELVYFQNSKYVFSYTNDIYSRIKDYLKRGEKVIFIGLPCQVAGLLGFLGGRNEKLIVIDIICHGTCPEDYLQDHIKAIGKNNNINKVIFRDPLNGTNKFIFSLYDDKKKIYSSIVHGTDVYQLGYHEALIYRENCYHCIYAKPERVGDITLSDFSGLGRKTPWNLTKENVSCVICSSEKGEKILNILNTKKYIQLHKRDPEEAFSFEKQLIRPSVPHKFRNEFVAKYRQTKEFEKISKDVLKEEITRNRLRLFFKFDEIRAFLRKVVPAGVKKRIKKHVKI